MAINATSIGYEYTLGSATYDDGNYRGELRLVVNSVNYDTAVTNITAKWVYVKIGTGSDGSYNLTGSSVVTMNINGTNYSGRADFDLRNQSVGATETIYQTSLNISGGAEPLTVSVNHVRGNTMGTVNVDAVAVNLPMSQGSSKITLSANTLTLDGKNALTVTINRASTSYTHTVKYELGNYSQTFTNVATSKSYVLPISWNNAMSTVESSNVIVTVTTYFGSILIGTEVQRCAVLVPSTIVPSLGSFTVSRINGTVPSAWGKYVQNKSSVALSISGESGAYGSTIVSYNITGDAYSSNTKTFTTGVIKSSGTVTYTAKITDSRGRTATKSLSIVVDSYSPPVINASTVAYRSNSSGVEDTNGTYVTVKPSAGYSSVGGKNTLVVKVNGAVVTNGSTKIISGVSADDRYTVTVSALDTFTTINKVITIPTAIVPLDIHSSGTGIAVGKVAETAGVFDCEMQTKFRKNIIVDNSFGKVEIGARNTTYTHFYTDRTRYYFDKPVYVSGEIYTGSSYNQRVFHTGYLPTATQVQAFHVSPLGTGYDSETFGADEIRWVDSATQNLPSYGAGRLINLKTFGSIESRFQIYLNHSSGMYIKGISKFGVSPWGRVITDLDMANYSWESDKKLKTNISPTRIERASDIVTRLEHVQYDMIENGKHVDIGYVADDLAVIYPQFTIDVEKTEVVVIPSENEKEEPKEETVKTYTKNVDHRVIIPIVTKCLQELIAEDKALNMKITELTNEIEAIKKDFNEQIVSLKSLITKGV